MTRLADAHLSEDELEALLIRGGDTATREAETSDNELGEIRVHLASCKLCRDRSERYEEVERRLSALRATSRPTRGLECPSDEEWLAIGAGVNSGEEAKHSVQHAAQCDYCGALLREVLSDMYSEITPAEEKMLTNLESSQREWRRRLSQEMSDAGQSMSRPQRIFSWWPGWAIAAAVIIVIAGFISRSGFENSLASTNRLLAEAYTTQRTLELRIPGAAYGPLRVTRGTGNSRLDRPAALLEAEAKIAKKQAEGQRVVDWLIVGARSDLLEWNYEAAIHSLREAEALAPGISPVNLDLATAYFERAQTTGHVADYGTAAELISRALEKDANDHVALFNRALIYERLSFYSQAAEDWKRYLQLDPNGDWSREAREHLAVIEQKLEKKKKDAATGVALRPEIVAKNATLSISDDSLNERIEQYQRDALTKWLPDLVGQSFASTHTQQAILRDALERFSQFVATRHKDTFLKDLLMTPRSGDPRFARSITDLAAAIVANESGDEQQALRLAQEAEKGFRDVGSRAGTLRAQFEQVYALQFTFEVRRCQVIAEDLATEAHQRGYRWLDIQGLIEEGFCANMQGNLALATEKLREAARVAKETGYEESLERAMLGDAVMQWQAGSVSLAWTLALEGVQRYWSQPASDLRGTSWYSLLDLIAEETQQWRLQEAVLKESLPLVDRGKDPLVSAQTRSRLAGSELMLHRYRAAEVALQEAMRLFHSVPQTASTLSQELVVSVNLAKVKMQSQQFVSSLAHLRSLQPRIEGLHENLSLLDFYATLGEVCRNMGLQIEAEAADRKAIAVFQASLATLHDARDRLTWYHEASAAYRSLVQLKLQQKDAKGALETWESYRESIEPLHQGNPSRPIRANRRDGTKRSAGISVVISKAGASETYDRKKIITYARLPDGLFGWIRADKSVQAARISGPNDEVIHLQTLFVQECSDPSSSKSKIADHGRQLYRKLVLPLAGRFSLGDTIVIEPDEELSDLPFAALLDETGQYFGSRYSLIISPGSRLGSAGRAVRRLTVQDVALLVVASTPADGRVHDPLAEEEVQSIAALFRNPVIISPMQSAKASFQQLLSQASVFHYAGHSQTTVRGGELLVQTRDRHGSVRGASLRSEDIERRSLRHCQLAVLSACDTGRGEEGRWLNRENLALAFLNAGVPEVVASQWQVDSNVTTRMMKDFYSRLIAGATTSDALRLAGAKVRSVPETSHPYYWAAFSVLSNASPGNGG